jgi:hypothetical protein
LPYKYKLTKIGMMFYMKMIPKFKKCKDEEDYHLAMLELSVRLTILIVV